MVRKAEQIRRIRAALTRVNGEVSTHDGSKYARGLSSEGYAGGYAQALRDVLLVIESDVIPSTRHYWELHGV